MTSLIDQIDAILPQTQCQKCTFAACRPYAEALVSGKADINQCPPGGQKGIEALAKLLDVETKPLDSKYGEQKPPQIAVIIEENCIGCVKCINACPVDAIIGAAKQMHTVISTECTGCELCISPCPVDCIVLQPVAEEKYNHDKARSRFLAKLRRQELEKQQKAERAKQKKAQLAKLISAKNQNK
jgi:electron transport complex protein RnfB